MSRDAADSAHRMVLAVDPGEHSGWSVLFKGMLVGCGLGHEVDRRLLPDPRFDVVIVERPFIYPGGRTKNPNDEVKLALDAGEWMGRYAAPGTVRRYVVPREWKGTIDKDTCAARVLARLDDGERLVVDDAVRTQKIPARRVHNMLDAIGIGLFAVRRFGP